MENTEHLTEVEAAILNILSEHKGKDNAIPRVRLVALVADSCIDSDDKDRIIRKTLEHLTERHFEWIGSGSTGYFMIETEEDRKSVADYYESYAFSLLHRAARVSRRSMLTLLGQMTLKLNQQAEGKRQ